MEDYSEPLDLSLPSVKMKNNHSNTDLPLDLSKKRIDNPQIIHSGPFSNSIIKNIPNFSCDKRSRIHQACGPSSIPYMSSSKPRNAHSCIPVRNNYADNYEDELETSETPFDFSCRYAETKTCNNGQKNEHSNSNYKGKKSKNNNGNFSIYAETDLDQPTDYSLRYAENNPESDVEVCDNEEKTATTEFVGDSVKTYCTEGTPYETPFNFSTSTSMSDLRIGDKNLTDGIDMREKKMKMEKSTPENEISDKISEEEIIVTDDQPQTPKMKSEFNSGLTSPEKPMNYCEEGTPGYFSRVSSFGSLNSAAAGSGEEKLSEDKDKCGDRLNTPKSDKMHQKLPGSEVKVVKFENIVNYCEETPLMFSRSSSLGSLDSIEQSMHDDRSSVISDFSRLTSGIISPSEIPDSPTQTVPPSPKQRKTSDLGGINRRQSSARRSLPIKWSIFEDDVTKFKEENTPAQFSVATSLSSLTIDDHDEPQMQNKSEQNAAKGNRRDEQDEDITMAKGSLHDETDRVSFHNARENMQNRCFPLPGSGQFQSNYQDSPSLAYNDVSSKLPSRVLPPPLSAENNTRTYNTEDTPAVLSRNGSVSELSLSTLSILDEEPAANRVYLSENSSQSSGERRNNLEKEKWSETSGNRIEVENVWVRRQSTKSSGSSPYREVDNLPPFVASKDECCRFAVEDSPAQFSLRSSLSHLTIESEMASGILDFSLPKEASESLLCDNQENTDNTAEHDLEHSVNVVECKEESSAFSKDQEHQVVTENISSDPCFNEEENTNPSSENTQSFELRSDDSRYNSMKKRKWKWKWQFGSEDGQHSESGDSTQTDRQSSIINEEFDNGRRGRTEKNNAGSLDASFKKKKWWKWKFGSKEKDQAGGAQETAHDGAVDDAQTQIANSLEERESYSKEAGTLETRNKSKRWKWKWKLNFKDDENSKSEKSSLGLSKLKHHVSPEIAKEPLCVNDVFQSTDISNEKRSFIKFLPENQNCVVSDGKSIERETPDDNHSPKNNIQDEIRPVLVRGKLDTPEPSDSEVSVIIEEINELSLSDVNQKSKKFEEMKGTRKIMTDDQSEYAVLVEECIQLGMPKKKALAINGPCNLSPALGSSPPNKENCNILTYNRANDNEIIDEYIELSRKYNNEDVCSNKYIETNSVISNPAVRNANRITNFDSSSLNRFSLGKASGNVFNSNDNILGDVHVRTPEKVNSVKRPSYSEFDGERKTRVVPKTECSSQPEVSGEIKEFVNGRITKQEMINSQSKRSVPKISESSYNSGRSNSNSSDKTIPKNTGQASSRSEISVKSGCSTNSVKSPDFAALIEECIQLGMPKRRESSQETLSPTLSPSLMHQKQNYAKRWPEYLSGISNENNKSASLPKPSSHHTTHQSYCASNEDFTASDLKVKRDLVLQRTLEKNVIRNTFTNNVIKPEVSELTRGRMGDVPTESEFNEGIQTNFNQLNETQSTGEGEESLYANADETRSIFSAAHKRELSHIYKSLPPERIIRTHGEFTSGKGENVDKRLQNIRRSLGRSSSQEMVKQTKNEKVDGFSGTADSEDEAVYANTTERYSTFRTTPNSESGVERTNEKYSSPKFCNVEVARSPVLPEKKLSPYFVSKNNIPKISSTKTEISSKPQDKQDFAAIIEECIQLGMPKRKEFSRETLNSNLSLSSTNSRCNSVTRCTEYLPKGTFESNRSATLPKGSTHFSSSYNHYSSNEDFSRAVSQRKNSCGTFGQDKNQLNIPKKEPDRISNSQIRSSSQKGSSPYNIRTVQSPQINTNITDCKSDISYGEEEPEESLYVNVSKHEAYSRSTNRRNTTHEPKNLPTKITSTYNTRDANCKEPNYSALVEECIKLGMPSKNIGEVQKYLKKFVPLIQDQNERSDVFDSPDAVDSEVLQIYANKSIKGSPSESVLNSIPRAKMAYNSKKNIGELEKEKVITSSNTIEKALEECIQLGWPKKKDLGKGPSPKFSITTSADASIKKTEKSVSKNVNVASVVRNMQRQHLACSKVPSMTTGAREDSEHQSASTTDVEEILTSDKQKNGFDETECSTSANEFYLCSDDNKAESEMSFSSSADVDVKLLDPHLVLQSLEKYTAQLISEAELRLNSKGS